jgi:hypothetical protein
VIALQSPIPAMGPLDAAPLAIHYPQFEPTNIPLGSRAIAAWQGELRPFSDDGAAREILRRLEANRPFDVCAGTVVAGAAAGGLRPHWAESVLVNMKGGSR